MVKYQIETLSKKCILNGKTMFQFLFSSLMIFMHTNYKNTIRMDWYEMNIFSNQSNVFQGFKSSSFCLKIWKPFYIKFIICEIWNWLVDLWLRAWALSTAWETCSWEKLSDLSRVFRAERLDLSIGFEIRSWIILQSSTAKLNGVSKF